MGNSQPAKRSNSHHKKSKPTQGACLACMPNYDSYDGSNLDSNELNIFKSFCQPKGKISPKSIAYLSKDEINFFKASAGRNISAIRYYLKKGVNVNTFDEDRTSPLHVAARHASIQVVEELINWGALVDITDSDGWSPIHVASFFQRPVVCHLLLKKGANPLIPNKDNARPADLARDPKLKEIFETFFSKSTGGASSNRSRDKQKFTNRNNIINHTLTETEQDLRIENSNNDNKPKRLILACNAVDLNSKQNSWDFLGNNEEPARLPNLIFPKQHKYYLYFKNLKVKSSVFNEKNPNQLVVNTINSLSFSDNDEEDLQANYLENQSELSSVIFCDDSQIEDNEDKGKNLALNFQINKSSKINKINRRTSKLNADYRQIKQNIPFKLKNIYTSFLNVKKGLKFQSKNSGVNQENNKAQLPLRSNFKPPSVDFASCKNVAHYTKNPLTLNKNIQRSYTPDSSRSFLFVENKVVSLKEFVKEKLSPNLTIENNFLSDKPDMRKMQWHEHHLSTEGRYLRMVEIGIDLFNFKAIYGISYLIFIKYLKNTPPAIAKFLHNQRSYNEKSSDYNKTIKKDKIQITSFLTNMKIKEILEVLSFFTESFIFRDMTFVCALKFFLNNFVVENDPGKIDILLYAFSRKYFKELKKIKLGSFLTQDPFKEKNFIYDNQAYVRGVFQHFDAVHMLSFATIMMDIEIHHMKRKDLDNIIKEYNLNVKGLNDGENFPKEFIDSIVENVLAQNLIVLKEIDELKEKPIINSLKQSIAKDADLFINIKKNKKNSKEIMFFNLVMVENLGFLFKNKGEENLVGLFVLENCNVKVKGINFSFVSNEKKSNKLIIYGKYCDENGIIAVKYKESLEFLLLDAADAKKIIYYVEKINKAKV